MIVKILSAISGTFVGVGIALLLSCLIIKRLLNEELPIKVITFAKTILFIGVVLTIILLLI